MLQILLRLSVLFSVYFNGEALHHHSIVLQVSLTKCQKQSLACGPFQRRFWVALLLKMTLAMG